VSVMLADVKVNTCSDDQDGRLVFADERLVAVLVRLSDRHGENAGHWYVEHGFGPLDGRAHPTFDGLDAAEAWIAMRLERTRPSSTSN
jgi:hypothetical protein